MHTLNNVKFKYEYEDLSDYDYSLKNISIHLYVLIDDLCPINYSLKKNQI